MIELTKTQAHQFILAGQGLLGKYRFSGKQGAYEYIKQAGCIQYDPVDICGKNAELTLQSRVRGFRKNMLEELLYQDRLLVDYPDKELSIWPAEDWPYFSEYRERSLKHGADFPEIGELENEAVSYIRANGPVSSDTLPIDGEIFWHSSMHWSGNWHKKSKAARSVLEQLYTDGTLIIHHKKGSRKYYDLAERCLDPALLSAASPCRDEKALLNWRVLRRIGAAGMLWDRNSPALLGIRMNAQQRRQVFSDLEASGAVLPVRVEGIRTMFYYRSEDDPLMYDVIEGRIDRKPRLEFLAPLDPLLWDKAMIAALWDFHYSWEIYTPADKRKYGSYTLPILWGDRFIGRIDAAADYRSGILRVRNIWFEPDIRLTAGIRSSLDRTLTRFSKFNNCSSVEFPE